MNFNKHYALEGKHAPFSASKYHWINYSPEKLSDTFYKMLAVQRGTELHEFAASAIRLGQKLQRSKKTLNMYVNDAIGYKMTPEQVLYYSDNFFGTADTICYRNDILRIHDLKTGISPTHIEQLIVYAALFCLEYKIKPSEIRDIELRIYQSNEILVHHPSDEEVVRVMDKIITFDNIINNIKEQEII